MKKFIAPRPTKSFLLAAGLMVLTFARAFSVDAGEQRFAVRPEINSAAGYGYGDYLPPGTGSQTPFNYNQFNNVPWSNGSVTPWQTQPAGSDGLSYPQPQWNPLPYNPTDYNSGYGQGTGDFLPYGTPSASPTGGYRDRGYTPPAVNPIPANWCPTGTCPLQTPNYPSHPYPGNNYPQNNFPTNPGWNTPNGTYPNVPYQPIPQQVNEADDPNAKITSRYQNSEMLAFLNRMTMSQATNLYTEASRLIDTRHVSPTSYEVRTRKALENLVVAVQNPAFLQASRSAPNAQQVQTLQRELQQLAQTSSPRTANEAIGIMQWAADLTNQRIGVRREAVALEFVNGTLDSLDKYSAFAPSKSSYGMLDGDREFKSAALEENIVGVGVELKAHDRGALILGTVENGPAARARLTNGDLIVGVDGRSLQGMSLSQIASLIGGPAGSQVTFRIVRNGQENTVTLRRENVYVSSVASVQMLDQTTGYARLKQFSESSAEDLEKAMLNLYQGGMRNMVLDLRGNPGGLLTESIQVSNLFVPNGRIVATKGRTAEDNSDERATHPKTWRVPLVVLVDENSASASEIFAAAIQENGRGVIVGRNTYGKGTVQTHFPLQSASGNLKLTTAKFYSPTGREIAGAGVRPDVMTNGKTEDFLAAGIRGDNDVRMAMEVMARGTPATLASGSGQNNARFDLSQRGN